MAYVGLKIVEPSNDAAFNAGDAVNFRGLLTSPPPELVGVALYYRWYSSLNTAIETGTYYSMNEPALNAADVRYQNPALGVGSHVITLAASDRAQETDEDLAAMRHAGVTGGEKGASRCVIHIFKANILGPEDGESARQTSLILKAEAPSAWFKLIEKSAPPSYEMNEIYQTYNRLRYSWELKPNGLSQERPKFTFEPLPTEFIWGLAGKTQCLTYQPKLTPLAIGPYRVSLFVRDALGQRLGSAQSGVNINILPG